MFIGFGFGSISGIAKQVTGSVSGIRKVLDLNPQISPFKFPPQVNMGIQLLNQVGIKVPTPDELIGLAQGKIDMVLKGVRRPILDALGKVEGDLLGKLGGVEGILSQIDWLL